MTSVAPHPVTKPETQTDLPPYDSLPPPPYPFNYIQQQKSSGYVGYYQQQYPSPGYDQSSSRSSHVYPPGASYPNQHPEDFVVVVRPARSKPPAQNFFGHVALACFVVWCCNPLFGVISFILAMLAHGAASSGNEEEARRLGHASVAIAFAAIFIMTFLTLVFIGIALA